MDENVFPPQNTNQNASTDNNGPVQSPQPIPPAQDPTIGTNQLAQSSPSVTSGEPVANETPRITLNDLYGPSQPGELQQQVVEQNQPQEQSIPAPVPPPSQSVNTESFQAQPIQQQEIQQPVIQPQPAAQEQLVQQENVGEPIASTGESIPSQPVQQPVYQQPQEVTAPSFAEVRRETRPQQEEQIMPEHAAPAGNGGFHFSSITRFLVGGIILLIIVCIIFGIGSLIFSGKDQNQKVTLTYWGLWEDSNVMQPILDEFHQQHPNITVTYIKQDPHDYTKRLLTRMQDGNGPDIFRLHDSWIYPLQSVLAPLPTSVIDTKQLQTNYPPTVAKDMVINGAVYGLPLQMDSLSLFINTDIFAHAGATVPTTWDNFITAAKALTVKDPDGHIQTAGAAMGTYDNVAHAPDITSLLLLQNGANPQKLNGSSNATDALSFYTSFADQTGSVWDNTLQNSLNAFAAGKVAMYFGYSYDILAIQTLNPSLKFTVSPVPHLPGRNMTVASYWVEGVSNRSKHQKESLEFMQFLAQKDTQTQLYTEETKTRPFGELYARTDLANTLKSNQILEPIISQFSTAESSIFAGDTYYDEYNGSLNQYLGNAINSLLKDTSASSAVATLAQGVSQVIGNFAPKTQK